MHGFFLSLEANYKTLLLLHKNRLCPALPLADID